MSFIWVLVTISSDIISQYAHYARKSLFILAGESAELDLKLSCWYIVCSFFYGPLHCEGHFCHSPKHSKTVVAVVTTKYTMQGTGVYPR